MNKSALIGGVECEWYIDEDFKDVDECASDPCQNGGNCTDGFRSYTCSCNKPQYYGNNCQYEILKSNGGTSGDCATQCSAEGKYPLITYNDNGTLYYYCLVPWFGTNYRHKGGWNADGYCYTACGSWSSCVVHGSFQCICGNDEGFVEDVQWVNTTTSRPCSDVCTEVGLNAYDIDGDDSNRINICSMEVDGISFGGDNSGWSSNACAMAYAPTTTPTLVSSIFQCFCYN